MKIALAVLVLVGGGMFFMAGGLQFLQNALGWIIVGVIALAAIALGSLNINHSAVGQGNSVVHNEFYSVTTTTKTGGTFVDPATKKFMGGGNDQTPG